MVPKAGFGTPVVHDVHWIYRSMRGLATNVEHNVTIIISQNGNMTYFACYQCLPGVHKTDSGYICYGW